MLILFSFFHAASSRATQDIRRLRLVGRFGTGRPDFRLLSGSLELVRHCCSQLQLLFRFRWAQPGRLVVQHPVGPEVLPRVFALQRLPSDDRGHGLSTRVDPAQRRLLPGRHVSRLGGPTGRAVRPEARSQKGTGHHRSGSRYYNRILSLFLIHGPGLYMNALDVNK